MVNPVNADPIFMTVKAIADRDKVSQAAVSKMVKKLVAQHGLEVTRSPNGSVTGVNHVHYDQLRGKFGDSSQQRKPEPAVAEPVLPEGDTLDAARLRKLKLDTEAVRLQHNAELRRVVRRDLMEAALARLAEEISRTIDVASYADRIGAAYTKGGMHGLRLELKRATHEMRSNVANQCAGLVLAAPVEDAPLGEFDTV